MSTFLLAAKRMSLWYGLLAAAALLLVPVVASATTIGNSITVTNDATISGNVTTTNVTSSGYMDIGTRGTANLSRSYTSGDLNVGNRLAVDGATWVSSTLQVTGNSRFYGTLTVDGASTLTGAVTAANSVSSTIVTSSRHIGIGQVDSSNANWDGGSLNVGNRLSVDGATFVSSTLDVTGLLTLYNGVSTTGGIYPRSNNALDLGGINGAAWRDVFVSSSLTIGTTSSTASSTAIIGVLSNLSAPIDFTDMASSSAKCTDSSNTAGGDVTVTSSVLGDQVTVAPTVWDDAFTSGTLHAFVQAMNKVRIIYCGSGHDVTSQDRDPASQRYRVTVWKF